MIKQIELRPDGLAVAADPMVRMARVRNLVYLVYLAYLGRRT